jgi:hypothetical protein
MSQFFSQILIIVPLPTSISTPPIPDTAETEAAWILACWGA